MDGHKDYADNNTPSRGSCVIPYKSERALLSFHSNNQPQPSLLPPSFSYWRPHSVAKKERERTAN